MRINLRLSLAAAALSASVVANAELIYGVTLDDQLITFDSAAPATILSGLALTGFANGEETAGIDFRPSTGQLYLLGNQSNLYTVNLNTGALSSVGTLSTILNGVNFGVGFNPTVDRIRIMSNTDQNLRVNPTDATVTVDGSPAQGTSITGVAYTNDGPGAVTTTLYGIEAQNNTLIQFTSPNDGTFASVGPLGFNASGLNGFDISATTGVAYAGVMTTGGGGSTLYSVNLATGAATSMGLIGTGATNSELRALAVTPVPEPASMAAIAVGLVALARRRRK